MFEIGLAPRPRQRDPVQMVIKAEIGIILPDIAGIVGHRHLPETTEAQHSPFDRATQALVIQLSFEQHDPDNLHQIARAIHAQPCGVDVGDTFVGRHCSLQKNLIYL